MTEVFSKRLLSEELSEDGLDDVKRQEDNNKKINKPGRKPLSSEPKNKRTAQNRAAQRAFRERKEQKMKELELKIQNLEDEKKSAHTESEFLRLQVQMLMTELAKHRGTNDISDLQLPKVPENHQRISSNDSNADSSTFDDNLSSSSRTNSSSINDDYNTKPPQLPFSFEFPWSRKNSTTSSKSNNNGGNNKYNNNDNNNANTSNSSNAPGLASDSSTTSSAESSPFELYNTDDQRDLPLFNKVKQQQQQNSKHQGQDFKFNEHFDEGINDFCKDLNQACGTKECPMPKKSPHASKSNTPNGEPLQLNKEQAPSQQQQMFNDDPLSFLNDGYYNEGFNTFDPTLAFASGNEFDDLFNEASYNQQQQQQPEFDPINSLTTEESIYDPFGIFNNGNGNNGKSPLVERRTSSLSKPSTKSTPTTRQELGIEDYDTATTLPTTTEENDDEVVPSRDGKLLKCTEIWDRITAHPKYSEIDIDGLCTELRSKAKCSDKGVVIDYADVNNVINNSITAKKSST